MLRNINMTKLPFQRKPETANSFLIDTLADHRAAYFILKPLAENLKLRRLAKMGSVLELLERLDPLETDWTRPVLVTDDDQARVLRDELRVVADRKDGSWFSDQARYMLDERSEKDHEIAIIAPQIGDVAVQGVLF